MREPRHDIAQTIITEEFALDTSAEEIVSKTSMESTRRSERDQFIYFNVVMVFYCCIHSKAVITWLVTCTGDVYHRLA